MDNFISIIRTDRKREINKYKNMKYSVGDEKNYRLIDRIKNFAKWIYIRIWSRSYRKRNILLRDRGWG